MMLETQSNWALEGHEWAVESLSRDVRLAKLRNAYLLSGPASIGKRLLALTFAKAILCQAENAPCQNCRVCRLIEEGVHPDVTIIEPIITGNVIKTAKINIDMVRGLIYQFSLRPVESERRIAIITDFETANDSAANALLKTLEEPPGGGVFILTAADEDLLLPTIISRCERLNLRPMPVRQVQQALENNFACAPQTAELLAHLSGGRLGWAIQALQDSEIMARRDQQLDDLLQLLKSNRVQRFAYAEGLYRDRELLQETLDRWLGFWRDITLIASGTQQSLLNIDRLEVLQTLAESVGMEKSRDAISAIQTAREQLQRNANARLVVEVLLLDFPRA